MKRIAIEEHCSNFKPDSIEKRLDDMDEAGIDMQVLSAFLTRNDDLDAFQAISWAKRTNDTFAEIVAKYPERFASFAAIALHDPDEAARELERAVKELGFKGTIITGEEISGEYIDNQKYGVILEKAEKLDVPIYLHPRLPSPDMIKPYLTYPVLSDSMWGFAAENGLHAMRLICGGVFDRYPRLKIILGHLGEGIPFWLWRIDNRWLKEKDRYQSYQTGSLSVRLSKKPSEYFKENFNVATSGMFSLPSFMCTYLVLGADKILFAVDYPAESAMEAVQFMDEVPICDADREKIYHLNAENLLGL